MPHHALEITLTRPVSANALHRAARELPLAANDDATRLMTVVPAKTPHAAARRLRRRLGARLPIDVITTHYPDADHTVLLNIAFPPATHAALTAEAARVNQSLKRYVEGALHRALAEHAERETDRLERAVRELLAHTAPAYLLSAVAQALTRPTERPTP
jgi:predicted HicB family RNase H-like nuclease